MNVKQFQARYRAWVGLNRALITIVAAMLLFTAGVAIYFQLYPRRAAADYSAFYYDLNNDVLFVANTRDVPPIMVPGQPANSPPAGALAFVYACRNCADDNDRYVGFIELYTPEAKKMVLANGPDKPSLTVPDETYTQTVEGGHLVARPDPKNPAWKKKLVGYLTGDGQRVIQDSQARCGADAVPRICSPRDLVAKQ